MSVIDVTMLELLFMRNDKCGPDRTYPPPVILYRNRYTLSKKNQSKMLYKIECIGTYGIYMYDQRQWQKLPKIFMDELWRRRQQDTNDEVYIARLLKTGKTSPYILQHILNEKKHGSYPLYSLWVYIDSYLKCRTSSKPQYSHAGIYRMSHVRNSNGIR